jgi:hypothetical protein
MAYQDRTFERNDDHDRRWTDRQILDDWRNAFPNQIAAVFVGSIEVGLSHVQSIRRLYNQGKGQHGQRDASGSVVGPPTKISLPYDEKGRPYAYSPRWLRASLDGRSLEAAGVSQGIQLGAELNTPPAPGTAGSDWTAAEVDMIVEDYFDMLRQELSGQSYSKSAHRAALSRRLEQRSDGSIEFKHQNISSVLEQLRWPYIRGYKPRDNFQQLLAQAVFNYLDECGAGLIGVHADKPTIESAVIELPLDKIFVPPPPPRPVQVAGAFKGGHPLRIDFEALDTRNRLNGRAGEEFVFRLEKRRLSADGRPDLAGGVEWVAQEQGDGLGYDVASFDSDGTPTMIEVKTTSLGRDAAFFVSRCEIACAEAYGDRFRLYRLFEFPYRPQVFVLRGRWGVCAI